MGARIGSPFPDQLFAVAIDVRGVPVRALALENGVEDLSIITGGAKAIRARTAGRRAE